MKYYEITPQEAEQIGYYKVSEQHHIDAKAGRLINSNFAISKEGLYGLTEVNGVDFSIKELREIQDDEWIREEPI